MPENTESETNEPKTDRVGMDYKQGPNPAPGGELDVDENAPPYEGRTTGRQDGDDEDRAGSVERQLADSEPGIAGQTASRIEESPAQENEVTDEVPDSDKGVGDSPNRSGEDVVDSDGKEAGRHDGPPDPDTGRPTGTSDKRDITGVG